MEKSVLLKEKLPLVAILRGIKTEEAIEYVGKLIELGYYFIEVPLNSPNALDTIRLLNKRFNTQCMIGAGTVTDIYLLRQVLATGVRLIVTPNVNIAVITEAKKEGCTIFAGVMTPSEAFNAIQTGATLLKLYPAEIIGTNGLKALKAILPPDISCFPVGGINADTEQMHRYLAAGAAGFGIGSALYKPGMSLQELEESANAFRTNYEKALVLSRG